MQDEIIGFLKENAGGFSIKTDKLELQSLERSFS